MNKTDLVDAVKADLDSKGKVILKKDVEAIVNNTIDQISEALIRGDKVLLVGFGTFEPRERAARKGRAPQTKQAIDIPAQVTAVFHPGKLLKDKLKVLLGKGF